jgi:N-acetylneuraminate synthase
MNQATVRIGDQFVGEGHPVFIVAEIGINHNGSLDLARRLIDGAVLAGADAVKFQKRTPEICVPRDQWNVMRETPWGQMSYIDYRHKLEFGVDEYAAIDRHCRDRGILWFASCWDEEAVDFMEQFDPPAYKAASASLTDHGLLRKMKDTGRPLILSTGMSTWDEIEAGVASVGTERLLIAHSESTYPGHETGLPPTWAAVAIGATHIERHITLDRAMWGSDQAASVEVGGFVRLVTGIRDIEASLGDGVKRLHDSELAQKKKLRRVQSAPAPLGPSSLS